MRKATRHRFGSLLKDHRAIANGNFVFDETLRITKNSVFGDGEWDWTDKDNLRLHATQDNKQRLNWNEMTAGTSASASRKFPRGVNQRFVPILPKEIVEDLKRAFYIIVHFPSLLRGIRKRQSKPITIVYVIKLITNFLSHLYLQSLLKEGGPAVRRLSDITLTQIRTGIYTFPYRCGRLKGILMLLAEEHIQINLAYGRLQWSRLDLKNLRWPPAKEGHNIETLPDPLFALLSNKSCDLVAEFHFLMGRPATDDHRTSSTHLTVLRWPRFREMFQSYISRRNVTRTKGTGHESGHSHGFVREFNTSPESVFEFLFDVQSAAFNVILLYTGMRYSEAASIAVGSLIERNGIRLIKSSLIKHKPSNMPIDQDEWVAISAVQDAVLALEEIAKCNFNPFLFANFETVKAGKQARPISNTGLTCRLNNYLDKIDTRENWKHWRLSPHQYRHGLVNQLARAEVGIPYITRQLKHYYTLLSERSYRIDPTATIYGQQRQRLVNNATGLQAIKEANVEIAKDLYGEGRVFAGGGAKLHIERTEAFFKGIALEGKAREQYIEKLAESGGGPIRTGVGFCMRNHVDPQRLKEAPPPCIGDLNCNPHTCIHSVVPKGRKADVIARYRFAAKQLISPDQIHLRSHWEAELKSYAAMLNQLDVQLPIT
jgi:Phage integrase family